MGQHATSSRFGRRAAVATTLVALGAFGAVGTAHAAVPATVSGTPCSVGVRACVDLDSKQAWLISARGSVLRGPVEISPGRTRARTPRGSFRVYWKDKDHLSNEFDDAPMPYSVFFAAGGIAFHEGDLDSGSSGCVRLSEDDAETFFASLTVGDRVQVT